MFSEEKLSQAGQKKYWYKIFLLKRIVRFGTRKNFISNLSIKMVMNKRTSKRLCIPTNASEI